MTSSMRIGRGVLAITLLAALALGGCAKPGSGKDADGAPGGTDAAPAPVTIGTLATQDALPLWVAEQEGYFTAEGLPKVEIVTFQSAQECQAAFTSGAVDALMTDIIVAAKLRASGTPVVIPTVMLGADTAQGRFAVVAAPGSGITTMKDLAGVKVGIGSATITELVLDRLMAEAGVPASQVVKEEVPKMPVRFQLLMSGQLKAASLPEPFVSLAVLQGATIVEGGDDTKAAENISQTVLAVNGEFASSAAGAASVRALLAAWDSAIADINASPDSYRGTLVTKAGLPEPLAESYPVSTYPAATPPTAAEVQMVIDWMTERGYLSTDLTPADLLGGK